MKNGRATVDAGAESVEKLREAFQQIESLVKEVSREVEQMTTSVRSASTDSLPRSNAAAAWSAMSAAVKPCCLFCVLITGLF